jgi:hypothetical protein
VHSQWLTDNFSVVLLCSVIVRHEVCPDGVERVVCRNICTKIHALVKSSPTQDIMRFSQYTLSGAKACGRRVYHLIKDGSTPQLSA